LLICFDEEQVEEGALGYSLLVEDDLEPLHIAGNELQERTGGYFELVAVLHYLQDERNVEVQVALVDVFMDDVLLECFG
jgi:hypothetical protein